ncbi:regulator [Noviherbaspirillum denitrificans]|uniref:Regulator n=2 Tax=Noviherbaspirillum denitrificans TaxID=1968433 RepID=A0A254TK84_9BURK|nr:regulator [Noviherbaspirillum denitrificans]
MGVAYYMGAKNREQQAAAPAVRPMQGPISPNAQMPQTQNHAGLQQQGQTAPPQGGKVDVDPNAKFTHFRVGNRNVKSIFIKGDVAWVGTSGGVVRYDTKTDDYRLFDVRNGLLSNGIFSIDEIGGRIMVGTYGGGMSWYDEKQDKWENFNIPQGLGDAFVYRVMQASNGDVWVATWSGANRIRGGALSDRSKWDLYTVENTKGGLINDWVYGLAEGKNGDIWMATEGGLVLFRNGKWENWNHAKGLGAPYEKVKNDIKFTNDPAQQSVHHAKQKEEMGLQGINVAFNPNYIVSMVVDKDGVVWAGTWGGGLSRFDGKDWRHYTVADGLPGNHVFMLHIDKKGQMWVGTNAGLARMEGDKFKVMTTENGLFSDTVFSMATAENGNLWVGSFGGVARLKSGF